MLAVKMLGTHLVFQRGGHKKATCYANGFKHMHDQSNLCLKILMSESMTQ